ncbi:hypothetical protein HUK80_05450 [Flavobacterium sp. MAH-1]|uniref:Uncharacterized protein n=1 Tax=Flavobacterium agri TaxID=2743471 RepID=A0A7Y8Y0Y0_9FLAO|nr:hypothetical protein [Flavobacterium agri]NUY80332.1 hypothetical protein [Flavobacterium agri]NYA70357.1 hypothetical protein [Flavobacterium agri]
MPDYLKSGVLITLTVEDLDQAVQVAIQNGAKVLFFFSNDPNDYGACHLRLKNGMVMGFLQRRKTAME